MMKERVEDMFKFYSEEDKKYYSMLKHMEIAKIIIWIR